MNTDEMLHQLKWMQNALSNEQAHLATGVAADQLRQAIDKVSATIAAVEILHRKRVQKPQNILATTREAQSS